MPVQISGYKYQDDDGNGVRATSLIQGANPDIIVVIDTSGSTTATFYGSLNVGDMNNDGAKNTILDAEISALGSLSTYLLKGGFGSSRISLIQFDSSSTELYNGTVGQLDAAGNPAVLSSASKLKSYGGTDYDAALKRATDTSLSWGSKKPNIIFISDGMPGQDGVSYAKNLISTGSNIQAFGVGSGAVKAPLDKIDSDGSAYIFNTPEELSNSLSGKLSGAVLSSISFSEKGIGGITIYVDTNNNDKFDASEPSSVTGLDGSYTINTTISKGKYKVKEVVPSGYKQTDFPDSILINIGSEVFTNVDFGNTLAPVTNNGSAEFSISGKGEVGSLLSIVKTKDDPEGNGKLTYKWQSSLNGATWSNLSSLTSSYTVVAADADKKIRATVSYVDGSKNSESVDTATLLIDPPAIITPVTAADFATPVNINLSLPNYLMSGNWNIDQYYYYVEQYPMTLRTAFYADYLAGRYTNEALYGQNHYLTGGKAEGRSLPGTDGILPDSNDYGAYVENYGITLLDIYRVDKRAVVNGGTMSLFAWGKEHYTNWGKAEGREISGGVEWGGIVRNNLDLYNQWQDAKLVTPSLSAFAFGYQRQNTIKSALGVLVGSDTADKLTGQIAYGLNGNDVICSVGGKGILAGGFGDDLLVAANGGSDLAYGGPGSDIFQLNAGSSFNIRDFRKGADMIQLGSTLTSSGVTMQWDSADNSTYFYNGTSAIGRVYGKRPTEFTYSDSTNGVSKVYI